MEQIKLVFKRPDLPPTLNGKDGLLRMHWSKRPKIKEKFEWLIVHQRPKKITGEVTLIMYNYAVQLMDWDNLAGRLKIVGDALVSLKYIDEDNPDVIIRFEMKQERVRKVKDVRIEFIFTKV